MPTPGVEEQEPQVRALPPSQKDDGVPQSTSCSLCGTTSATVQEQRQHVKSDFHRYNLKLSVKQVPPVDEATFTRMIGDLDESISGSDTSDSEDEDENVANEGTLLSSLLKRQAKLSEGKDEDASRTRKRQPAGTAPMIWMTSPKIAEDDTLGMYKALLTNEEEEVSSTSLLEILRRKQLTPIHAKQGGKAATNASNALPKDPHYFLCMIGGGHFAAMIVSLVPEIRKGAGGVEERHAIVRAHKTFHRYTTRRKQGGSQSANDNAKGNAHSVGSSIRRANEAALELDIRNLLAEWRSMIDSAGLVFVRATGSQNRRILFGPYDGQVLTSRDKRLRSFPFSTKRATQSELLRAFQELTRLKASKLVEIAPEPAKTETPKVSKPKAETPKMSKEDEAAQLHTSQLQNLIRRSKAPGVLLYLQKNELLASFQFFPVNDHHHAPTALHLASSTNAAAVVSALLLKAHADPALKNGDGKTAYDLAGDGKTRDAFRVARYQLGDAAFDWSAAHVPTGISQADTDVRTKQEQATSEAAEAERRKADLEKLRQQDEQRSVNRLERKAGTGKSLAAATEKTGAEKREEDMRGLTPEQRTRIERERRARAAEERMRRMQGTR